MAAKSRGIKGQAEVFGNTAFGVSGPYSRLVLKKTAIVDATATGILRISCPNISGTALLKVLLLAGVNNAGARESARVAQGVVAFNRIPGAALVGTAVALSNAGIATSGTATLTLAYDLAAVAGGVTAVNTIDVRVTLTGTGTFTDHQIVALAELLNSGDGARMTMAPL